MKLTGKPFRIARGVEGFTLLEVLLTVVILAVGLLGLAAMQVVGLKSSSTSNYRSVAVLVAGEMTERMRANPTAVANQKYANVTAASADCNSMPPTCGVSDNCLPDDLVAYDLNVMYCGEPKNDNPLDRGTTGLKMLPNASMTVSCKPKAGATCVMGTEHVITVQWDERPEGTASDAPAIRRSLVVNFVPLTNVTFAAVPGS